MRAGTQTETWLNGSAEYTGNAGAWTPFTVDDELGYVYLPVEAPTSEYYGGHRPGRCLQAVLAGEVVKRILKKRLPCKTFMEAL